MSRVYPLPQKVGYVSALELAEALSEPRCNLSVETRTQADLLAHLRTRYPEMDAAIQREVRLSKTERVDLWVNGIVVEVKLKGCAAFSVYRQLVRYAEHPAVEAIILATNITMALPDKIEGKPAYLVSLGRAWMR